MPSNVPIFQKIEATCDICNIFIVNVYNYILVKNKNMLRTFCASKELLNKNVEHQIKFWSSYKKNILRFRHCDRWRPRGVEHHQTQHHLRQRLGGLRNQNWRSVTTPYVSSIIAVFIRMERSATCSEIDWILWLSLFLWILIYVWIRLSCTSMNFDLGVNTSYLYFSEFWFRCEYGLPVLRNVENDLPLAHRRYGSLLYQLSTLRSSQELVMSHVWSITRLALSHSLAHALTHAFTLKLVSCTLLK